ncbi:MAG: PRTRC system protein C [Dehalococcoidia bacterium]
MARLFVYDGREFPDPDPTLSVENVRRQLAEFFPELANADARQETRGEDTVITFAKRIGTKGRRRPHDVVAILRRVPAKRLRILDLVAELVDGEGELDIDAAAARQPELNLAVAEAKAYARATEQATEALRRLPAR